MKPFFKVVRGRTRDVLLIGCLAFKVPSFKAWRWFLRGLLDNMHEVSTARLEVKYIAPIFFYIPGGFLNVMPRCDVFSKDDYGISDLKDYREMLYELDYEPTLNVVEFAVPENFGYYKGTVVAIDYGHGNEYRMNRHIVEEDREKETEA